MECNGDSQIVVAWLNGDAKCLDPEYTQRIAFATDTMHDLWKKGLSTPRTVIEAPWKWRPRAFNEHADRMANRACDESFEELYEMPNDVKCLRGWFDGACRANAASGGWWIEASVNGVVWRTVLEAGIKLLNKGSMNAELTAASASSAP